MSPGSAGHLRGSLRLSPLPLVPRLLSSAPPRRRALTNAPGVVLGQNPGTRNAQPSFLLDDLAALTDSLLVSLSFDTSCVPNPAFPTVTSHHGCLTSLYSPRLVAGYNITDQTKSNPIPPVARTVTASDPRPQPPGLLLLPFLHFLSPTLMRPLALQ